MKTRTPQPNTAGVAPAEAHLDAGQNLIEPPAATIDRVLTLFGRASFHAHVFEMKLLGIHAMVSALEIRRDGRTEWTVARLAKARLTCGQILNMVRSKYEVPLDIEDRLRKFIALRNHLVHGFYRSYGLRILSESGRFEMVAELAIVTSFLDVSIKLLELLESRILREMAWPPDDFRREFEAWVKSQLPQDMDIIPVFSD